MLRAAVLEPITVSQRQPSLPTLPLERRTARMDTFVTRKRKASPEDESTEVKLAILSSLHPDFSQDALLDSLLAHDGSVDDSSAALFAPSQRSLSTLSRKPGATGVGSQTSLRTFARPLDAGISSSKKPKLLSRKGATLHLFDPADIAEHTPCSIIHNFLPSDLANDLLREMLEESRTYEKATFKLFDTVVSSPHTASFYVESHEEMQRQKVEVIPSSRRYIGRLGVYTPSSRSLQRLSKRQANTAILQVFVQWSAP